MSRETSWRIYFACHFIPILGWFALWLFEPFFWRMAHCKPGESYVAAFQRWPSEAKMHFDMPRSSHPLYRWATRYPRRVTV